MNAQTSCGNLPERLSPTGISVLVVGAGIAGLMTALELWRKGNDVRIIERTASRVQSGKQDCLLELPRSRELC